MTRRSITFVTTAFLALLAFTGMTVPAPPTAPSTSAPSGTPPGEGVRRAALTRAARR
jgi:hypothetical protein